MRVTYFAHDLSDPAVVQRVRMLSLAGASVRLLGFRRSNSAVPHIDGTEAVDLGQTFEGRLLSRAALVFKCSVQMRGMHKFVENADLLLARNMEMATIADAARLWTGSTARLVYECLDIHPVMLRQDRASAALRCWERRILRRSSALVVSSLAFVERYFATLGCSLPPVVLVENKRVCAEAPSRPARLGAAEPPPWCIGWYGNLRCERSFHALVHLAQANPKTIEVRLRGVPTRRVMKLIAEHLPLGNMEFGGPYSLSDLGKLYGTCHFAWAIDYFQAGSNSEWLLPNRIYEGSFFGTPMIALEGTETGRWLAQRRAAILLPSAEDAKLDDTFTGLSAAAYGALWEATARIPLHDLVHTPEGCAHVVASIAKAGIMNVSER